MPAALTLNLSLLILSRTTGRKQRDYGKTENEKVVLCYSCCSVRIILITIILIFICKKV